MIYASVNLTFPSSRFDSGFRRQAFRQAFPGSSLDHAAEQPCVHDVNDPRFIRSVMLSMRNACIIVDWLSVNRLNRSVLLSIDIRFLNLESINLRIDLSLERMDPLKSFLASSSNKRGLKYFSDNNCNNFL